MSNKLKTISVTSGFTETVEPEVLERIADIIDYDHEQHGYKYNYENPNEEINLDTLELKGTINTSGVKNKTKLLLELKIDTDNLKLDLTINADKEYVDFEDKTMEDSIKQKFDLKTILVQDLLKITTPVNIPSNAKAFKEFKYTSVSIINQHYINLNINELEYIEFPETLTSFSGEQSWLNAYKLKELDTKNIKGSFGGTSAFSNANSLEYFFAPRITNFGNAAFAGPSSFKYYIVQNLRQAISFNSTFIPNLKSKNGNIYLANSLQDFKNGNYTELNIINLNNDEYDDITSFGKYCLYKNKLLKAVDANNITSVSLYAFADCSNLESVNLPNIQTVEGYGFNNCSNLKIDNLVKKINTVGTYAFGNTIVELDEIDLYHLEHVYSCGFADVKMSGEVYTPKTKYHAKGSSGTTPGATTRPYSYTNISKILALKFDNTYVNDPFNKMTNLELAVLPNQQWIFGWYVFENTPKLKTIICLSEIPYTQQSGTLHRLLKKDGMKIYVPNDESVIESYKTTGALTSFKDYIYPIGGPEWTELFGSSHEKAYLLGTIAEKNGHLIITKKDGTIIDGNHLSTECVNPQDVLDIHEKYLDE